MKNKIIFIISVVASGVIGVISLVYSLKLFVFGQEYNPCQTPPADSDPFFIIHFEGIIFLTFAILFLGISILSYKGKIIYNDYLKNMQKYIQAKNNVILFALSFPLISIVVAGLNHFGFENEREKILLTIVGFIFIYQLISSLVILVKHKNENT